MKLPVLALGVATTLVAGAALADQHKDCCAACETATTQHVKMHGGAVHRVWDHDRLFFREVLYPELPPTHEVAREIRAIVEKQEHEVAMLRAMAPRTRTAGFTNISTVYEHMATDHAQLAEFGRQWLRNHGFDAPAMGRHDAMPAGSMDAHASVHEQIRMHEQAFNEALQKSREAKSNTVAATHLWGASATLHHISLLRVLDRDVEMGRQTASARLQMMLDHNVTASSHSEYMARIYEEDRVYFEARDIARTQALAQSTTTTAQQSQGVERVQVVERIVEVPVERVVERVVERPVERIVERVVERKVYVTRPQVRSRVAGRRQNTRRPAR